MSSPPRFMSCEKPRANGHDGIRPIPSCRQTFLLARSHNTTILDISCTLLAGCEVGHACSEVVMTLAQYLIEFTYLVDQERTLHMSNAAVGLLGVQ